MADLGWPELLTIALAVFVLFGWKHLPDAARSLGRSIRIFRFEVDAMHSDGDPVVGGLDPAAAAGPVGAADVNGPHVGQDADAL